MSVLDYSTTASSNTSLSGIGIQGSNKVSNFDNALRQFMADIAAGITRSVTKSSGPVTAVQADHMQLWRCTATLTINLTAASTLTSGWQLIVFANGGTVTIDPNASETINGAATLTVANGSYAIVICDGTGFYALAAAAPDLSGYVPFSLLTTRGDLPYRGASTWQRLAKGTAGQVLTMGADDPTWSADLLSSTLTTRGDIIYRGASAPQRLAKGTAGQVLTMGADDPAWGPPPSAATLGTAQASTSGTAIDFTGLPAGLNSIDVMLDGVSLSGTDFILIQLGDAGGIETTGYTATARNVAGAAAVSSTEIRVSGGVSTLLASGLVSFRRQSGNVWVFMGSTLTQSADSLYCYVGRKELSDTLDRIRVTRSGSNTFDAGSINIYYA